MESYKEFTCEFLASMKHHEFDELDRAELDQGWGITFLAKGEKKMVTFRQLEILFGFTMEKICPQGSCQHLLCKESHWTINEGEVKLLDMGIKPIISRTRMGRRSEEIGHTQGISCLSLSSSKPTSHTYNTRHQRGRKLSVGGVITPILCAAGVKWTREVGHEGICKKKRSSSIELRIELRLKLKMECRNADLGEPECYYFEEYEAPRMNPSVVAAHKRIGLLQKFNKWQGKAMERCKSPWTRW
ncbi:unnamed protein product [Microthlaspi erraticum]|uniref:Arabidopsis retrotransposon Orf1 C-terminal domain-containing protein n=1 Tax=Microthlaspi erraticum TaxID=1685480 RepID=A0A6D2KRJ5_9BRAS|nr:unnamed protein product [Microthlaspi erraticum]